MIVVQFSSLYTDRTGKRFFIIETHSVKVTAAPREIIDSIDYINVNISYVRGVIHNVGNLPFSWTRPAVSGTSKSAFKSAAGSISRRCVRHRSTKRRSGRKTHQLIPCC
jgi:hypothetical protein